MSHRCTDTVRRATLSLALAVLGAVLPGACNTVEYYEKRAFSDPTMVLEDGATETHWYQKVYYSIEGSAGGIGTSAGGGCGCY
jgi:hypothetical protein